MKSHVSGALKIFGGSVLMFCAYYTQLQFSECISSDKDQVVCLIKEALLHGNTDYESKITNALEMAYIDDIEKEKFADRLNNVETSSVDSNSNINQDISVSTERKSTKKVAIPLRVKNFSSGPFKGGKLIKGTIKSNFYVDARTLSVPVKVIDKVISNLSSKIDFRRSLRKGDQFEIAFNANKELIYSKIKTKRKNAAVYKFNKEGYFFENGEKVGGGRSGSNVFGRPIRGKMKVTSPFGVRIHPITRRSKKHTGVDLAVRYGTPIYAIYDGVITRASGYSGYGKCVDIKHKNGYSSRYAHLSKCVARVGTRVKKGQLIAFSGSSGMATGPHLHLELARNNVTVNPLGVKMMPESTKRVSDNRKFATLKNYFRKISESI